MCGYCGVNVPAVAGGVYRTRTSGVYAKIDDKPETISGQPAFRAYFYSSLQAAKEDKRSRSIGYLDNWGVLAASGNVVFKEEWSLEELLVDTKTINLSVGTVHKTRGGFTIQVIAGPDDRGYILVHKEGTLETNKLHTRALRRGDAVATYWNDGDDHSWDIKKPVEVSPFRVGGRYRTVSGDILELTVSRTTEAGTAFQSKKLDMETGEFKSPMSGGYYNKNGDEYRAGYRTGPNSLVRGEVTVEVASKHQVLCSHGYCPDFRTKEAAENQAAEWQRREPHNAFKVVSATVVNIQPKK